MQQNILVTGATGMVGKELIEALKKDGCNVSVLSRDPAKVHGFKAFKWDVYKQEIDAQCMEGIDTIVHLAGEPIADKKWSSERKKQIIDSRVQSANLLFNTVKKYGSNVKHFISASAVGYYGDRADEVLTEESAPGTGFVASCCEQWEAAADQFTSLAIRVVKVRVGIVLGKEEGSLPVMAKPIKLFAGAALGSGHQWVPWVHHSDLVGVFLKAIQTPGLQGVFNASAPHPVTNKTLTHAIAKALHRPVWPFNIPKFMLDLILGSRSILPLMSARTTSEKIEATGYAFKFPHIADALKEIYK